MNRLAATPRDNRGALTIVLHVTIARTTYAPIEEDAE